MALPLPIQLTATQAFVLGLIHQLDASLNTLPPGMDDDALHPANFPDLFHFAIKGGAAAAIHLHRDKEFPFPDINDIDVEVLVEPITPNETYSAANINLLQKGLLSTLIREITRTLADLLSAPAARDCETEWRLYRLPARGRTSGPIRIHDTGYTSWDLAGDSTFTDLFADPTFRALSLTDSPFRLQVFPNLFWKDKPLNLAIIRVSPNIEGPAGTSLLDIVFTKPSLEDAEHNAHLRWTWESVKPQRLTFSGPLGDRVPSVPIADPLSVVLDQRLAANLNTRPEKVERRRARAAALFPAAAAANAGRLAELRASSHRFKTGKRPANMLGGGRRRRRQTQRRQRRPSN